MLGVKEVIRVDIRWMGLHFVATDIIFSLSAIVKLGSMREIRV